MAKKRVETDVKEEMFVRAQWLHIVFTLVGILVILRLVWVLFFSAEIAVNAEKLEERMAALGYHVDERQQLGLAIGAHVGPGACGFVFVEKA